MIFFTDVSIITMPDSVKQVAIQGITGSYHEIAARQFFGNSTGNVNGGKNIGILECHNFPSVITKIKENPANLGLMAIENTIAGSLLQNHELIRTSGLTIAGEYKLRISHCLAALPGTKIQDIKCVASHPMALRQCEVFLETELPNADVVERNDTASSAQWISENKLEHCAAVCSKEAAAEFHLEILAREIETDRHNFTRFLMLANREAAQRYFEEQGNGYLKNKASLVFALPHSVGSLSKVLTILSFYDLNLTKLQSFPLVGSEWQYSFYIDFTYTDYYVYQRAIDAVLPLTRELRILGEYAEFQSPPEFN
ncbi:prephenate dehydratase [Planctomycetales bacterium]|nr:prephenate dehydratase [Planctomycetales bacterium]